MEPIQLQLRSYLMQTRAPMTPEVMRDLEHVHARWLKGGTGASELCAAIPHLLREIRKLRHEGEIHDLGPVQEG